MTEHKIDYALLADKKTIREALVKCLFENDLEAFEDILIAHLHALSKTKVSKETKIGRQTLYDLIQRKKKFNPTLSTLGPILKAIAG